MPAENGNQYWKIRAKDGRNPKYTPEELRIKINEYFKWVVDNPLKEEVINFYQGQATKEHITKMRAMTIHGLCSYLGIVVQTFKNYTDKKVTKNYKDFLEVIMPARQIIYNYKFEGAAANMLNANIIARDLGLIEKREIKDETAKRKKTIKVKIIGKPEKKG